ncbi:MAG: hypothetical protein QXT19_02900 [Candidatus Woesearchaeota archaeon]
MSIQTIDSKTEEPHTKPRMLKPERLNVAVDQEDSSSIDFCVQKTSRHGLLVALYVRPTEEDIFDLLPGLMEYHCREFARETPQSLNKRVIAQFFAKNAFCEVHEDAFGTREALEQRKVIQYIFLHKHKNELYEKFQWL